MFKNGYKIIFIKEGKFDLKQFNISPLHLTLMAGGISLLTASLFFIFSEEFVQWTGSREIEKHRANNEILVKNIEESEERIRQLMLEIEEIKKQDDVLRKLVKLPPIHEDIRKMGYGGIEKKSGKNDFNYLLPNEDMDLDLLHKKINHAHRLIKLENLSYSELTEAVEEKKDDLLAFPAIFPVKKGREKLSSNFGYRRDPFSQKYKHHDGHDFSASIGASVVSTANGRVKKSKYWGSFGNYIEVDHGNGYVTVYGHLSSRAVKKGDKVFRGQKIGEVGNTGRSTAPHLHYEIQYKNKALDPVDFYFDIPVH
ncbi:MAG: M23 family metallopeptidase [Candidatus Marinimicrobia bacterium]|nr:M23 family metallopeptidase [Candidatus Neomarinimicrobiota bacterium]